MALPDGAPPKLPDDRATPAADPAADMARPVPAESDRTAAPPPDGGDTVRP